MYIINLYMKFSSNKIKIIPNQKSDKKTKKIGDNRKGEKGKVDEKTSNSTISYFFDKTEFGDIIIAQTNIGIAYISFFNNKNEAILALKKYFKNDKSAIFKEVKSFANKSKNVSIENLNLSGTEFQLKVWEELLKISKGKTSTYADIALKIGNPKAVRAVGTAISKNPVALIIPCHRIIRSDGEIGKYRWGSERKKKILGSENAL